NRPATSYNRNTIHQSPSKPYSSDERPIVPLRRDYTQITETDFNPDGTLKHPDYEPSDISPTRDQIRSTDGDSRLDRTQRTMSALQRSTNSLSRTINPRQRRISPTKSSNYLSLSRTIGQKSERVNALTKL
ncbi:unnamed protein product, partial [Didymodactylos carnosus]